MHIRRLHKEALVNLLLHDLLVREMVILAVFFPRPRGACRVGHRKSELPGDLRLEALDQRAFPGARGAADHHCVIPSLEDSCCLPNNVAKLAVGHIHVIIHDDLVEKPGAVGVVQGGHHVLHAPDARVALCPLHQGVLVRRGDEYVAGVDCAALQPIGGVQVDVEQAALLLSHYIFDGFPRRPILVPVQRDASGKVPRVHVAAQLLRGGEDEVLPVHLAVLGRSCGVPDGVPELPRKLLLKPL
mmetsp:Transcript_68041/g.181003  ORF Transcript_68041/g.181003 Transcript_68041/m.181003 type:complete len:243 (+) Transcript_68041:1714-2442(+)